MCESNGIKPHYLQCKITLMNKSRVINEEDPPNPTEHKIQGKQN